MSKKNGCIAALAAVLLVFIGGVATLYCLYVSKMNPSYHGKRVRAWAEQAIGDPDPTARQEATEALLGAFKDMREGEPRIQLTMRFCGGETLPKELIPFLIETLHAEEMPPGSYQSMALSRVEGEAAIPVLVDVIMHDGDANARAGAVCALDMMLMERDSEGAEAALRSVADGAGGAVQKKAQDALKRHEEWLSRRRRDSPRQ